MTDDTPSPHTQPTNGEARASLELLLSISRELAATLDLSTVLERVLILSTANVGAERGSLLAMDANGRPLEAALTVDSKLLHPTVQEMQAILDHGLAGWVAKQRQPVMIANTSQDERWTRRPDDSTERSGSKSAICMPLIAQEQLVGVLTLVHARPNFFSESHFTLLQAIADLASIAIRNAQLYGSVEAAQRRYYDLFDDSIDPVLISSPDGHILECNRQAQQTSAYDRAELIGLSVHDLHAPAEEKVGVRFEQLEDGATVQYESNLLRADGTTIPIQVSVRRVQTGSYPALQWIFRDISERKQLDRMRDDLAAMVYHDLRSPLANITSSLDLLDALLPAENSEDTRQVFEIAQRAVARLQRMINSLLDINRLESGQNLANLTPLDISALIHEVAETTRPLTGGRHQQVTLAISVPLPAVNADTEMIRRVLINLVENASKFSPLDGTLEIGAQAESGQVRVWVQDSGPGISPEYQEVIFEKFRQLKNQPQLKGFGIGLAFCRLAVQAHGGKIWVESQPDQGSRFIFTLPAG